ncbi:hypothetical protein RQ832_01960 [Roseomonas sp. DSM 102946]|nr:hypothetical protein [Roseomonas sp. DSM 102946]
MAVFVVTWNLNQERSNYAEARRAFIAHLERYPNRKDSGLESVRWISTDKTPDQINDDLKSKLDRNDRIFISRVNSLQNEGWLEKDTWAWINQRL